MHVAYFDGGLGLDLTVFGTRLDDSHEKLELRHFVQHSLLQLPAQLLQCSGLPLCAAHRAWQSVGVVTNA